LAWCRWFKTKHCAGPQGICAYSAKKENKMENINIEQLVSDIKTGEEAYRGSSWDIWCKKRGLGRTHSDGGRYYPADYVDHMTSLYTLRAFLRGRMHRENPPEEIRDFNRSMQENGSEHRLSWDMEEHNRKIAQKASSQYEMGEAA